MKKVTQLPEHGRLKPHKTLKFMSALTMALPMFLGSIENAKAAREVDNVPQTVSINSKRLPAYVSRVSGAAGYDSGLFDRMSDNEGDVFYCLDPSKYTPNGNVSFGGENNEKVRAVMRAGTGGALDNTSDEGYMATQLAIWTVSGAINNITWSPGSGADQAATDRVHAIYDQLIAASNDPNWQSDTSSSLQIEKVGEAKGNEDAGNFTQTLKVTGSGLGDTVGINLQGVQNATITQDGQTVSNNQVKPNDEFTVTVPFDFDQTATVNGTVTVSAENRRAVAANYNPSGNYQRTTTLYTVKSSPINASADFSFSHTFKTDIPGNKVSDEDNPISKVKFGIYKDNNGKPGDLVKEVQTDDKGVFSITDLTAGTYWLKEIATGDDYILDDTPHQFVVNHKTATTSLGKIINNHKQADVSTTATNQEDGTKKLQPVNGKVTVNDHVVYNHVFAGKKYKLTGTLMDKATGKPLTVDGKTVTATKEFTPTSSNGSVDIQFTVDAATLAGKKTVVYETLTREDNTKYTTKHENINDEGQTVEFTKPSIHTTATNNEDGSKQLQPLNNDDVKDTVSYTDLIPGKKYKMQGTLMDKSTGKPVEINGKTVTATQEFTPKTSSGSVDMHFKVDATKLKGHDLVVFETAYYNGQKLVDHQDLNDKGQTVSVTNPSLHTTLTGDNSQKLITGSSNNALTDTVSYTNLVPGKQYKITGTLMDKNTGQAVTSNGQAVSVSTTFTPKEANGTVDVHFEIDGSQYKGHSLVAYEALDYKDQEIANHKDLNDVAQTVNVDVDHPAAPITNTPSSVLPQTNNGKDSWLAETIGVAAMVITVGSAVRFARRHDSGLDE